MIPVRKPGRPLSSCPHPPNRNCGCGTVTAAIPRNQKCHCRLNPSPSNPSTPQPTMSEGEAMLSTRTTFRIQKSSSSSSSPASSALKPSAKKLSAGAYMLDRIDPTQVNIMVPPTPQGVVRNKSAATFNYLPVSSNSFLPKQAANFDPTRGYTLPHIPQSSQNGSGQGTPALASATLANGSSCCSRTSPTTGQHETNDSRLPGQPPPLKREEGPSPSVNLFSPFYSPQTTIYTYPPMYGTYMHPLQPGQWREAISMTDYSHQAGAPAMSPAYTNAGNSPITAPTAPESLPEDTSLTATIHSCSCGDQCQCIGCAAHPYNEATQRYVRSAWDTMMEASPNQAQPADPAKMYQNGCKSPNETHPGPSAAAPPPEGGSPPAAQTPSDTTSNGEQGLSANDFFFVSYPFAGDGCGGDTASCPCGDDCQCLGCAIHNVPGPPRIT